MNLYTVVVAEGAFLSPTSGSAASWPVFLTGAVLGAAATTAAGYFRVRAAERTAAASQDVARRNLLVETVTKERAQWREQMREATVNLVAVTHAAFDAPSPDSRGNVHAARSSIRLRVNSNPLHALNSRILAALSLLGWSVDTNNRSEALGQLALVEANIQYLLKEEWDKSKKEAETGEMVPAYRTPEVCAG